MPAVELPVFHFDAVLFGDLLSGQPITFAPPTMRIADEGVLQPPGQPVLAARLAQVVRGLLSPATLCCRRSGVHAPLTSSMCRAHNACMIRRSQRQRSVQSPVSRPRASELPHRRALLAGASIAAIALLGASLGLTWMRSPEDAVLPVSQATSQREQKDSKAAKLPPQSP